MRMESGSVTSAVPVEPVAREAILAAENAPEYIVRPHPRPLGPLEPLADEAGAMLRYQSPLRYPGAKSGLVGIIGELVIAASTKLGKPRLFVEPFAGGASTSLRLAGDGLVDRVLLADADPLVACFWRVAAEQTDWLIDRMWDEPVTLERWDFWRAWTPKSPDDKDLAVKCLFLNRTTFSGILHGRAGPIGGRKQESAYKIDCRFNKDGLAARLRFVGDLYRSNRLADVWSKDWRDTMADVAEWYKTLIPDQVITYLDPPYMEKSAKLYGHSFDPWGGYAEPRSPLEKADWLRGFGHYYLAEYLRRRAQNRWILSYDHHPELTANPRLYMAARMNPSRRDAEELLQVRRWPISKRLVDLRYSAAATRPHRGKRQELLLTTLPPSCIPLNKRFRTLPATSATANGEVRSAKTVP
jgi:DNA adenine methylase